MNRPGIPLRARTRLPRFRAKNFSTCTRSPTARGSSHASHSPWDDVAFSSTERDRHLGIRPVSQLNTWPVVSPVNASRRPSRDAAHHSGSGRLARPSPWGTFTSYSLPASWRTPEWVKSEVAASFDHLVGDGGHRWRNVEAERRRGLEMDDQLEFSRLHHRQVGGLGAVENLAGINAGR